MNRRRKFPHKLIQPFLAMLEMVMECYHAGRLKWDEPYTPACQDRPYKPRRRLPKVATGMHRTHL